MTNSSTPEQQPQGHPASYRPASTWDAIDLCEADLQQLMLTCIGNLSIDGKDEDNYWFSIARSLLLETASALEAAWRHLHTHGSTHVVALKADGQDQEVLGLYLRSDTHSMVVGLREVVETELRRERRKPDGSTDTTLNVLQRDYENASDEVLWKIPGAQVRQFCKIVVSTWVPIFVQWFTETAPKRADFSRPPFRPIDL